MKKLIYLMMIAAVLVSCKKNTTEVTPQGDNLQEVEFNITSILNSTDRALEIPICNGDLDADYAEIWLDGFAEPFFAGIYDIGDSLYTKAIMLPPGTYTLKEFYVWDDGGTPGYDGIPDQIADPPPGSGSRIDDQLYKAAPMHFENDGVTPTEYWQFVKNTVDQTFEVLPFLKTKIYIDVLCYVPHQWYGFGFFWFNITEITIREMCFFGDICVKDIDDYVGSWYEGQSTGLRIDMPAIFMIKVYQKVEGHREELVGTYDNRYHEDGSLWLGEGAPLCFRYADYDKFIDYYRFELWVYVADGSQTSGFGYVLFDELVFQDEVPDAAVGDDGVVDFVIGNCLHAPADDVWVLAPYMNLPESGGMYLRNPANPGQITGAYWDVRFYDFGPGYDIVASTEANPIWYAGWCGDETNDIPYGDHDVDFFSTLDDPILFPAWSSLYDNPRKLEQLNYLFNHFESYGLNLYPTGLFPSETKTAIQESIWMVVHDGETGAFVPADGTLAFQMGDMALSNASIGYKILPGGDAGVLMYQEEEDPGRLTQYDQLILIVVDP